MVKIQVAIFWVVMPYSDVVGYNVSEDNAASIFKVKRVFLGSGPRCRNKKYRYM